MYEIAWLDQNIDLPAFHSGAMPVSRALVKYQVDQWKLAA
jgi:hypothetical protein